MKTTKQFFNHFLLFPSFILGSLMLVTACGESSTEDVAEKSKTEEAPKVKEIIWNVKGIHPDGKSLAIKAYDNLGNAHDVKAIQDADQHSFLDVRAIVKGKKIPVKMLVSSEDHAPIKAIDRGATYYLKAITPEGEKIDVRGVARIGSIVIMRCVTPDGKLYPVRAVSPEGKLNDVRGIKINTNEREMSLHGQSVYAHVKAMHPSAIEEKFNASKKKKWGSSKSKFERIKWNVKAVTPEGMNLDIKAFDKEGNQFDVKATQDSEQHSFMSVKAFLKGFEVHVRVMDSPNKYAPVKAVGSDGTLYDVKAVTEDGEKLDVKGVSRSGKIVHVKAINEKGEFYGVKAFSPDGTLNDVKGIKIFDRKVELKSQGHPVYAHLKAISQ